MVSCPPDEALCEFAEGGSDAVKAAALGEHIDKCSDCRMVVAALAGDVTLATEEQASDDEQFQTLPTISSSTPKSRPKVERIGRFLVRKRLGAGGMGAVYLATDPKLNRLVAVKVLNKSMGSGHGKRLQSEARAMAGLSHPAILPVYEVGEHEGNMFIAMEYVSGLNLRQWLRKENPDWREVARVFTAAGRGLAAAHDQKLIHRDFKPDNVLIGEDGRVRVADFGLAKWIDDDKRKEADPEYAHTGMHSVMGTPGYIAPEQVEGREQTPAVDQFSFCVALFETLFRKRPFQGRDAYQCHEMLLKGQIAQVSLGPVPAKLHALACKGLNIRPEDRFADMAALLAELEPFGLDSNEEGQGPFPGLSAFTQHDSKFYFGHEEAMNEALATVATRSLLTIVGPSGAGKSSFVRAGLLPQIARRGGWKLISMQPGHSPMRALSLAVGEGGALDALRAKKEAEGDDLLLVVDQFEELYTQCGDAVVRELFIRTLLGLIKDTTWGCVVLCLRSDFLDELGSHRSLAKRAMKGLVYLSPPDQQVLRDAIVRPLDLVRYSLEDDKIAERLSEELADRPGALPLLQFAMAHLWRHRDSAARQLTTRAFEEMGDVGDLLAGHADRVLASLPANNRSLVKKLLLQLITRERTRNSASLEELHRVAKPSEVDAMLAVLVEARLVIVRGDEDGDIYELIHEALISNWPTLDRWLDQQREDHGYLREVGNAAKQWVARQRAEGLLWRDEAADELAAWEERAASATLSEEQADFVRAVLAARLSARRRKRRWMITAFAGFSLVTGGALIAASLIASARQDALEQAREAEGAAVRARAAEIKVTGQFEQLQKEIAQRKAAEAKIVSATESVNLSREQLIEALQEAKLERGKAEKSAKLADKAAAREREAARAAARARDETRKLLAEKERQLKKALLRKKIIVDDL